MRNAEHMGERAARVTFGSPIPSVAQRALASPWRPLDAPVRDTMASRFGHDFGRVRIHADETAAAGARQLRARAYTVGADVVFGRGEYAPQTSEGRQLLAHELAHVVQQQGVGESRAGPHAIGPAGGDLEADAGQERAPRARAGAPLVQRQPATRAETAVGKADETRAALLAGSFTNGGTFTYDGKGNTGFHFTDRALDGLLHQHIETWAPTVKLLRRPVGVSAGDSEGKPVNAIPPWVNDFQERLIGQRPRGTKPSAWEKDPQKAWDENSAVAQRLLEAFFTAWAKASLQQQRLPTNLQEMFAHVGASETNRRADVLGGTPEAGNWCNPAAQRAVALGLLRHGLRFKTGTPPVKVNPFFDGKLVPDDPAANAKVYAHALDRELVAQAAWYLAKWTKKALGPPARAQAGKKPAKLTQLISGTNAWTEPLRPGDHISLIGPKSPVSGHVATIIKEEGTPDRKATAPATLSTVYYISGNAAGVAQGEGAVRVEQVTREMPPASYSWDAASGPANEYDRRKQAASTASDALLKTREKLAALVAKMNKANGMDVAIGGVESVDLARLATFPAGKDRDEAIALVKQRSQQTGAMQSTEAALGQQVSKYGDDPAHTLHRYDDPKSLDPANAGKWRPTAEGHMWVVEVIHADKLDADAIAQGASGQSGAIDPAKLEAMGLCLEPLPGTLEDLYPGGMAVLEGGPARPAR